MISFPNSKINLGLRIIQKRGDGFHEIETIMYPVGLTDVLEILESLTGRTEFCQTGLNIASAVQESAIPDGATCNYKNLVFQMYELLAQDYSLPSVYMHLHKNIPVGAGLGGGSADCAFALIMLNNLFKLELSARQQQEFVSQLGSDCAFFLDNKPALATGRGEILEPVDVDLSSHYIYIVKPHFNINTALAYSWIKPYDAGPSIKELIKQPVRDWKKFLVNDFENPVFEKFPGLQDIKHKLYNSGALYASMSGSGSALFGIFDHKPKRIEFPADFFQWSGCPTAV